MGGSDQVGETAREGTRITSGSYGVEVLAKKYDTHIVPIEGGFRYSTLTLTLGGVRAGTIPDAALRFIEREKESIAEFISRETVWTKLQTAIAWAMPEHLKTDEINELIVRHMTLYSGNGLTRDHLAVAKELTKPLFPKIERLLLDLGFDVMTPEESRRLVLEDGAAYEAQAERRARQDVFEFSKDLSTVKCYYGNRTSLHIFADWGDGVERCDCEAKRFNWDKACKHERARELERERRKNNDT